MEYSPIQIHLNSQFHHFLTTEIPRALDQIFTAPSKEDHLAACSTFRRNVSNFLDIQKRTLALLSLKHTALINICPVQGAPACNIICPATFHRQRIQALAEQIHQTLLISARGGLLCTFSFTKLFHRSVPDLQAGIDKLWRM